MTIAPLLIVVLGAGWMTAAEPPPVDYQQRAAAAVWSFIEEDANAQGCAKHLVPGPYDVRVTEVPAHGQVEVAILRNQWIVHEWAWYASTVFAIHGDRLYYVLTNEGGQGGVVVAVDLRSGLPLWHQALAGIQPVDHSKYRNELTIVADGRVVTIVGNESAGRYLEYHDAITGATVGHREFADQR
jgi:hypothetical protein